MESKSQLRRVERIEVLRLFGLYDHKVRLNDIERLTIIHGPNGAGKTVLLKLTYAMLSGNILDLAKYPYKSFSVHFNDGSSVTAVNSSEKQNEKKKGAQVVLNIGGGDGENVRIEMDTNAILRYASKVERIAPVRQIGEDRWMDMQSDEMLDANEVIARYGGLIADEKQAKLFGKAGTEALMRLQKGHGAHLVEAQRLIKLGAANREEAYGPRRSSVTSTETVVEYSNDLRRKIETALADYAKKSQQLDQSFPQRLLATDSEAMSDLAISLGMKEIQEKQLTYQSLGLINKTAAGAHPFDAAQAEGLDAAKRSVMGVYVRDTKEKFEVLDDLAVRVNLLLKNINAKFQNKEIVVSRERGLTVKTLPNDELPISALSSGEQHEIVLMYELLFRIKPNTLVMIDEPELSLHVNWQERFLSDLAEVIKVAGFDALIATHSPYIISDRSDLLVELSTEAHSVS